MSYVGPEMWNAENEEMFDAVADERLEAFGRDFHPLSDKHWICGVCRSVVTRAHFKRHLKKHDRERHPRTVVDAAWREFDVISDRGGSDAPEPR